MKKQRRTNFTKGEKVLVKDGAEDYEAVFDGEYRDDHCMVIRSNGLRLLVDDSRIFQIEGRAV